MATLLSTVQQVARRLGQPVPDVVFAATDPQVLQFMALLEEGLDDLSGRGKWERLVNEATLVTVATESQGTLASIATNGFRWMLMETLWDRTNKLPLVGPMDSQDWQALKAIQVTGPRYTFRIRGGELLVTPVPTAGYTWAFEYISENTIRAASAGAYKKRFTVDTDEILLPDQVVQMDLRWRWKKEKGLAYAEDFDTCEKMIADALGNSGGKKTLYMDDHSGEPKPGIFVPAYTNITRP